MLAKKVRRLLHDGARRRSHNGPLARAFTIISGRRMTPIGCECLVSLAETSNSNDIGGETGPPVTRVLRRRRAVVPGVAPGELLRTQAHHYDTVTGTVGGLHAASAALPQHCQTLERVVQRRRRKPGDDSASLPPSTLVVAKPRRPLPCAAATSLARCQLCPWMAVGAELSASIKAEVVRAAVDAALRDAGASIAVKYLDPFLVPARPNSLEEAELAFVRERGSSRDEAGASSRASVHAVAEGSEGRRGARAEDAVGAHGRFYFVTHPTQPGAARTASAAGGGDRVQERRKQRQSTAGRAPTMTTTTTTRAGRPPARDSAQVLEGCLLATLEQKRLAASLSRWAAQLPLSMREAIGTAYISQPSMQDGEGGLPHTAAGRHPWKASLLVTLTMHKDVEQWGPQSPLCGPSHPDDVLSVEEQKLVDAVLAAAPLLPRVAVHVLYSPREEVLARGGVSRYVESSVGFMDCLYPVTARNLAVADALRLPSAMREGEEAVRTVALSDIASPPREVVCYLLSHAAVAGEEGEGEQATRVSVAGMHSSVQWLGVLLTSSSLSPSASPGREKAKEDGFHDSSLAASTATSHDAAVAAAVARLPLAAFWRHRGALDAACSILFSVWLSDAVARSARFVPPTLRALRGNPGTGPAALLLAQAMTRLTDTCVAPVGAERSPVNKEDEGERVAAVAALLNDAGSDVAALLKAFPERGRWGKVRLLLVQCSTDMQAALVQNAVAAVVHEARNRGFHLSSVEAGVVDVDPLSAACVAYAVLELRHRPHLRDGGE